MSATDDLQSQFGEALYRAQGMIPNIPSPEYEPILSELVDAGIKGHGRKQLLASVRSLNQAIAGINELYGEPVLTPLVVPAKRWIGQRILVAVLICVALTLTGIVAHQVRGGLGRASTSTSASDESACRLKSSQEKMLSEMKVGESGYMLEWGAFSQKGRNWVNPTYPVSTCVYGTMHMPVKRESDGYHIWTADGYKPRAGSMANYEGQADVKPLSAVVEH